MSTQLLVAAGLSAVNALLLAGLGVIWVRNYRTFRSTMVLGLLAFDAVLLVENLIAVYFFFSMRMLYAADGSIHTVVVVLRGLEFLAVSILAYVTAK